MELFVAVAIVAQAVMGMARTLCPDRVRASIAIFGIFAFLTLSGSLGQVIAILIGGAVGFLFVPRRSRHARERADDSGFSSRRAGVARVFFLLLGLAFIPAGRTPLGLFDAFHRSGALVFGGGHVVLPLLRDAVVSPGWISDGAFLAGYGGGRKPCPGRCSPSRLTSGPPPPSRPPALRAR